MVHIMYFLAVLCALYRRNSKWRRCWTAANCFLGLPLPPTTR